MVAHMILLMVLLLYLPLQGELREEPLIVNSGEAVYDGKKVLLIGEVVLEHSLGQISAHRLAFFPLPDKGKKTKCSSLEMSENVQILLKEGGQLHCQQAEVDYVKMQGNFLGNEEFPDVIYRSKSEEESSDQKSTPLLEVKSNRMTLDLMRDSQTDSSSPRTLIKQIEAIQDVRVGYNNDHLLVGDYALYQRLPQGESTYVPGLLTLTVRGNHPFCQLTNLNGDRLHAKMMQVNTIESQLWLAEPAGQFLMKHTENTPQTLEFKANELMWDHKKQMLTLKGAVDIVQNGNVHVKTDDEISIADAYQNGKHALRSIESPKMTSMSFVDAMKGVNHSIFCPGHFKIDHEKQEMTFRSAADGSGGSEEENQVHIDDDLGEVYANRLNIRYTWEGNQFIPKEVILDGNVRVFNRFDGHIDESGSVLHYALADRVDYSLEKEEMVLSASEGRRVLFFDKVNNVQMSAPSLKIHRDPSSGQDTIKGIGDVRFTFLEKELEQFKQHFKLNFASQETDHVE